MGTVESGEDAVENQAFLFDTGCLATRISPGSRLGTRFDLWRSIQQHSLEKNHLYFWHYTHPKALMRGWWTGLFHSISGRL